MLSKFLDDVSAILDEFSVIPVGKKHHPAGNDDKSRRKREKHRRG
jgi:hypothetical protein